MHHGRSPPPQPILCISSDQGQYHDHLIRKSGRQISPTISLKWDRTSILPPWDVIFSTSENYLLYCDCQPLPLFDRSTFMQNLKEREPEVLYSLLALALRFNDDGPYREDRAKVIKDYVEAARALVMKKVMDGLVELCTIQSLCLLSLVDFTGMHLFWIPGSEF